MIPKSIDNIQIGDIANLIGVARESKTLEFKADMPTKRDGEIVSFLAGISALANTVGGDFLLGVEAADGVAVSAPGIAIVNVDAEKLRLEQILANGLEPRLPRFHIVPVQCSADRYVFVLRVPRSWIGPHRVKVNNQFYGRNSAGRYPLDVSELRSAFVLSESVSDRIRSFRAERLLRIDSEDTPIPLPNGGRAILHVIPFPSFASREDIDVVQATLTGTIMPLPLAGPNQMNTNTVNLDGFVSYCAEGGPIVTSYVQLFRNGAIESVMSLGTDERNDRPYISGPAICKKIVFAFRQYVDVLKAYDIGFPVFAFISFSGMDGSTLRYNGGVGNGYHVSSQRLGPTIIMPGTTIDGTDTNVHESLKSVFNALWNAFGLLSCDMYDEQGSWRGAK